MFRALSIITFWPLLAYAAEQQPTAPSNLPNPSDPNTISWAILVLFGIVGMANQGLDFFRKVFPKETPPAHEKYATKNDIEALIIELNDLESDHDDDLRRLEDRINENIQRESDFQKTVMHALGRIEAKVDAKK